MGAHEHLFVYRKAVDAAKACERVARSIEKTRPDLADQLRRASCSVVLNIAEGAAEWTRREKLRLYRIARRSAGECEAILGLVKEVVRGEHETHDATRLMNDVFALLVRTARAVDKGNP